MITSQRFRLGLLLGLASISFLLLQVHNSASDLASLTGDRREAVVTVLSSGIYLPGKVYDGRPVHCNPLSKSLCLRYPDDPRHAFGSRSISLCLSLHAYTCMRARAMFSGALVLGWSLRKYGGSRDFIALVPNGTLPAGQAKMLTAVGWTVQEVARLPLPQTKEVDWRFEDMLVKLYAFVR